MIASLFQTIHEDDHLLVINKAAGLVCHPTKGGIYSSLISRVRVHLGPDVPAQLINRLDRETSGLVVLAKNPTAARDLRHVWEKREVAKEYFAIVHGTVREQSGTIEERLGKDLQSEVAIKDCVRPDGAQARTDYMLLNCFARNDRSFSLLRVLPFTGRKHQIRIHLAHIGHPIVGDKLYGGDETLYLGFVHDTLTSQQWERLILRCHALHAGRLMFQWRGMSLAFEASPEAAFTTFLTEEALRALDGASRNYSSAPTFGGQ